MIRAEPSCELAMVEVLKKKTILLERFAVKESVYHGTTIRTVSLSDNLGFDFAERTQRHKIP